MAKKEVVSKYSMVKEIARKRGVKYDVAKQIVDDFIKGIIEHTRQGKEVHIRGFGKFSMVTRAPKTIKVTGQELHYPERKMIKFQMSAKLKREWNPGVYKEPK